MLYYIILYMRILCQGDSDKGQKVFIYGLLSGL